MVTVTASLLSASNPQPVQIILTGVAAGSAYVVTGQDDQGNTWTIPGATGVSTDPANSYDFIDVRTPLNSTVTYAAVVDGVTYTSDAVTVAYAGQCVVQDLDGQNVASVNIASLTEKRTGGIRTAVFPIAGRAFPAVRVDVAVAYQYEWEFDTTDADTDTMQALLASGKPIVRRCQVGIRDFDPVIIGVATAWSDELVTNGIDTLRRWTLTVQAVDDPEPSTVRNVYTWADFDAVSNTQGWVWDYSYTFDTDIQTFTGSGGTLTWSSTVGRPHAGAAELTVNGASPYVLETASIPVTAGALVGASAWVSIPSGRTAHLGFNFNGGGAAIVGTTVTSHGSWIQVGASGVVPAGATTCDFSISFGGTSTGDICYVDDVAVGYAGFPVMSFADSFPTWADFDSFDWATLE